MSAAPGLSRRAVTAVALTLGFYTLALAMTAGLLYLPYAVWRRLHHLDIWLLLFCLAGALGIIVGAFPRIDRLRDPGPQLTRAGQPRLFALLEDLARQTGQELPRDVYLVHEVSAWMAPRGGVMGIGSHWVMGIGLPLMQLLTIQELRGVLAHEIGHYQGGDTRLGPWLHKTADGIQRTLRNLLSHHSLVSLPFIWYGNAFLRVTHGISRNQEFAADALAARVAGPENIAGALLRIYGEGELFMPYWTNEVGMALEAGVLPAIVEGYIRFLSAADMQEACREALRHNLMQVPAGPHETHPCLRERLTALGMHESEPRPLPADPSMALLDDPLELERLLLQQLFPDEDFSSRERMSWDESGNRVWMPAWSRIVAEEVGRLAGLTPAAVAELAPKPGALAARCRFADSPGVADEDDTDQAVFLVGAALATLLHREGWIVNASPGAGASFRQGSRTLWPFESLRALVDWMEDPEEWLAPWVELGLAGEDLGGAGHRPDRSPG